MDTVLFQNLNIEPEVFEQYFKPHLVDGQQSTVVQLLTLLHPYTDREVRTEPLRSAITSSAEEMDGADTFDNEDQDPTAVVTPDIRVMGVKGLRVVDASIMSSIVSGNINILTIAMAERADDSIKKQCIIRSDQENIYC
ncbi:unnamed protein product [Adineta ricciae]|uniref:Glucose-methanol-choline oxidoreductase C-terminal domain-containing protein n=1 Tax=Adineta ricciae TaxID=249248 RepID=A0A815EGC3_ADIRI|nr:unnamed protein product [Adineta ricciae]